MWRRDRVRTGGDRVDDTLQVDGQVSFFTVEPYRQQHRLSMDTRLLRTRVPFCANRDNEIPQAPTCSRTVGGELGHGGGGGHLPATTDRHV